MLEIVRILCQVTVCIVLTVSPACGSGNSTSRGRTCHPTPLTVLWQKFTYTRPIASASPFDKGRRPRHAQQHDADEDVMITANDDVDVMYNRLSLEMMSGEVRERTKRQAQNSSSDEQNVPLWHCEMKRKWKSMKDGIYPRYIETGRCRQTQCFLNLYECRPRKYVVNVLKRSRRRCVPVPQSDSQESRYEERWRWRKVKVTVGCECSYRHGVKDAASLLRERLARL